MKGTNALLFSCLSVVWMCCTSGNSQEQTAETTQSEAAATPATSDGTCLFDYDQKLDQLLTKDMIAQAYALPAEAEFDYSKVVKGYHRATYSWPSDRTRTVKVMGRTMDVPVSNQIGIGLMQRYREEDDAPRRFRVSYHNLTEQELQMAKERMAEQLEKQEDKNGNKLSESQQQVGKGLLNTLVGSTHYEVVEGLGDAAVWERSDNALIVLVGKTQFRIFAEVSADSQENKKLAQSLASAVLAQCN